MLVRSRASGWPRITAEHCGRQSFDRAVIGHVPNMGTAETRRAIEFADAALPAWRARTAKERAAILRRWFDLMMANQDDLAR